MSKRDILHNWYTYIVVDQRFSIYTDMRIESKDSTMVDILTAV